MSLRWRSSCSWWHSNDSELSSMPTLKAASHLLFVADCQWKPGSLIHMWEERNDAKNTDRNSNSQVIACRSEGSIKEEHTVMRQLSAILLTNHGQFTDRLFQNSSQLSYHLLLLIYVPHCPSLFVFFYFLSTLSSPTLFVHPLCVAWPTMLCSPLSTMINSDSLVFYSKQKSCLGAPPTVWCSCLIGWARVLYSKQQPIAAGLTQEPICKAACDWGQMELKERMRRKW